MADHGFDPSSPPPDGRLPISRIQKIISSRMLKSKQEKPSYYLRINADMTLLTTTRREIGRKLKVKLATNDFLIKAMALAVEEYPLLAADLKGDFFEIAPTVNIGLAISAPQGLVVPVIKDCHTKSLIDIAKDSQDFIEKARSNKLTPNDLSGACITLTNLGVFNIESFYAVMPPGQCAILAIGRNIETSIPIENGFAERKLLAITLAADYRIVTARYGAQFLNRIKELLESPRSLI